MKTPAILSLRPLGLALAFAATQLAAQPAGYFAAPKPVPGIPTQAQAQWSQAVTPDGLTIIFNSDGTLYQATRSSRDQPFANVQPLGPTINTSGFEATCPTLTIDGLALVFQRDPPGPTDPTSAENDLFEARRASVGDPFGVATPLPAAINSFSAEAPNLSPDGLMLLFNSTRPGGKGNVDIWVTTRASRDQPFGAPVNFDSFFPGSQFNTTYEDYYPSLSSDALTVFSADLFGSRPGGGSGPDIWVATRPNRQAPFGPPMNLNQLGLGSALNHATWWEGFAFVSRDWPEPGSKLYFVSDRNLPGSFSSDYFEAEWVPFRFTGLRPTPSGLQLDFTTKSNRTFDVQYRDDLSMPGWTSLQGPIMATTNSLSVTDPLPPGHEKRFYRVVAP